MVEAEKEEVTMEYTWRMSQAMSAIHRSITYIYIYKEYDLDSINKFLNCCTNRGSFQAKTYLYSQTLMRAGNTCSEIDQNGCTYSLSTNILMGRLQQVLGTHA